MGTALLGAFATPLIQAAPHAKKAAAAPQTETLVSGSGWGPTISPVEARRALQGAIHRFGALSPDQTHCQIFVDEPTGTWQSRLNPDRPLFVGSAIKTFILAQNLIDAASGYNGASLDKRYAIDNAIRSPVSPVLASVEGTQEMRYLLEAMIAHSDNTATDIALAAVSPDRVRALIADAGLTDTRIPTSTRSMISYLAGAPVGVDWGWRKVSALASAEALPSALQQSPRVPLNPHDTMASTAIDMVRWYRNALRGEYFPDDQTLREFKRIQRMGDAIDKVVPDNHVAYAKGGSIDWNGFHALSVAGQMLVGRCTATFCFSYNWTDADVAAKAATRRKDSAHAGAETRTEPERFQAAVQDALTLTAAAMTA